MSKPFRAAPFFAIVVAVSACATAEKTARIDAAPESRARTAEALRPDARETERAPMSRLDGEPPDGAFISLVQPGDGTISLSVRDGVLPEGDYKVGLTIAEVCIDPIGTAAAAAAGGPEAMIPVLEVGALHVDARGRTAFLDTGALDAVVGADLSGTAILIVPAGGPDEARAEPIAELEEDDRGAPAVICAVLDPASVEMPPPADEDELTL